MSKRSSSYEQILRSTTIFGAVQVLNILVSVLKSKAISILLGPSGMGIVGLFNSTINLISSTTKIGLDTSAVKEIASIKEDDSSKQNLIIKSLRYLIVITGLIGAVISILFSSTLSKVTFGNSEFTIAFIWLSLSILFKQLTVGELAILQSLRKLNHLAKANVLGSFLSLLIAIPLYYFYNVKAIVPVIIITTFITFVIGKYYTTKLGLNSSKIKLNYKTVIKESKGMIKLGLVFGFRGLLASAVVYLLQVFIGNVGSLTEVGLYAAGITILNTYVGLIFNAMQTDYFPRLSSVSSIDIEINKLVNEQALIALLLICPVAVLLIAFAPEVIKILFSKEFLGIITFVSIGIIGVIFKSASWSMGYVIIAKGNSKLFLKTGLFFNILWLVLLGSGYYINGLFGLTIGFLLYYILHFLIIKFLVRKLYGVKLDTDFFKIFLITLLLSTISLFVTYIDEFILKYILLIVLVTISIIFSWSEMNKKIDIKETIKNYINKRKK